MTPERWAELEALFYAARERAPDQRAAFLEAACGSDAGLRHEVDALLEADRAATGFLEPRAPWGARSDVNLMDALQVALGDAYVIERELGGGGMSRLFLATERSLQRQVVVKLLPPELASEVSAERFRREMLVTARLQHPHVLPVLNAGAKYGLLYYVMPYVSGESLRACLKREGRISIAEAARILRDLADALAYAHREGIVHRDLKPENVLLEEGHALLADFGIARALAQATLGDRSDRLTGTGLGLGTPGYMAPEQLAGEPTVDARADLYALGVVAYEMLAGHPPFTCSTAQALVRAHLSESPELLSKVRPEAPPTLAALVMRLLEKDPDQRPQAADEVLGALDAVASSRAPTLTRDETASSAALPRGGARRRIVATTAAGVALAALLSGTYARVYRHRVNATHSERVAGAPAALSSSAINSIAVLPLVNVGGSRDDEYFADGMTDELAGALANIEGLRVAGRNSAFAFKGKHVDSPALGRALNVGALLEGSVRRAGGRLRVATQLVSVTDGLTLWSHTYERDARDVFAVQDEIAQSVVAALRLTLRGATGAAGAEPSPSEHPISLEAHDLYLRGIYHNRKLTEPDLRRSIALFEEALVRDSAYAQAWAGLALAWENLADDWVTPREAYPRARAAAERALALDPALADAHTALGGVLLNYDWQFAAAEREFLRALELSPNNPNTGLLYCDLLGATGRADSALALARRAHAADPLYTDMSVTLASLIRVAGKYDEAMAQYRAVLDMEPERADAWQGVGSVLVAQGRLEEALAAYRRVPGKGVKARVAAAVTLAQLGRRDEARRDLASIIAESRRRYVRAEEVAAIYSALGERDSAFAWLDSALRDRSSGLRWLENPLVARYWDPIRYDPRFRALVRKVGLPLILSRARS